MTTELLELAIVAARYAGDVILGYYRRVDEIELKDDGSPLTLADRAAHNAIAAVLQDSGIPMVSEEGDDLLMDIPRYWLVDPLDGTKDFIAANDEFTVNVALIEGGRPVLGVVFAPALRELYAGQSGIGSWCEKAGIRTDCRQMEKPVTCRMAVSRFHDHPDVEVFAVANGIESRVPIGSALKYGLLAVAQVDVFPRLVGSSEWDTAAGQAVLEGVGGQILDWSTGQALCYGKPRRRNPRLLSFRAPYDITDFRLQHYETGIP